MMALAGLLPRWFRRKRAPPTPSPQRRTTGEIAIERCAAEIAGMWRDHYFRILPGYMRSVSLDQRIEQFSAGAFQIIRSYPLLHEATQAHLWMIYFKGLLLSQTHPEKEMKAGIRIVADRHMVG